MKLEHLPEGVQTQPSSQSLFQPQVGRDDLWSFSGHPTLEAFPGSSLLQVVRVLAMGAARLYVNSEEGEQEGCGKLRGCEESTECRRIR